MKCVESKAYKVTNVVMGVQLSWCSINNSVPALVTDEL